MTRKTQRDAKKRDQPQTMDIELKFEKNNIQMTEVEFEGLIIYALESLHGQVGASIVFEVKNYQKNSAEIELEDGRNLEKFWSALTLCGQYEDQRCMFQTRLTSLTKVS